MISDKMREEAERLLAESVRRRPVNEGRTGIPTPPPGPRPMIDYGQRTGREGLEWYDRKPIKPTAYWYNYRSPITVRLRRRLGRVLSTIGERIMDRGDRLRR